jgi:hypothetical protein
VSDMAMSISGGNFAGMRPSTAFTLLREWIERTFPESVRNS